MMQPTAADPIDPNAVYTVAEAAMVTRIGQNTLRRLAGQGQLRAVRVGTRVLRFLGADLLAFLQQGGTSRPVNTIPDQIRRRPRGIAS